MEPIDLSTVTTAALVIELQNRGVAIVHERHDAVEAETTQEFDLRPASVQRDRLMTFATEYESLCRKYGLQINACGCCNSPWLTEIDGVPAEEPVFIDGIEPDNIVQRVTAYCEEENI